MLYSEDFTSFFPSVDQPLLPGLLRGDDRAVRALHILLNENGEPVRAGLSRPAEVPRYSCCTNHPRNT